MQADMLFDIYAERQKRFMVRIRAIFKAITNKTELTRKMVLVTDTKG